MYLKERLYFNLVISLENCDSYISEINERYSIFIRKSINYSISFTMLGLYNRRISLITVYYHDDEWHPQSLYSQLI